MGRLIMTMGLPASGKSSWAKDQVKFGGGRVKRVNKDDLRMMLDLNKWSPANEKLVLATRDFIIKECMLNDYDIVIDDTNLNPKMERQLKMLVNIHNKNHSNKYELVVNDTFLEVPVNVCIDRDEQRLGTACVGHDVINSMARDYERWYGVKLPELSGPTESW